MTTNIRNIMLLAVLPLFVVGCASSSAQKARDRGAVIGGVIGAAADGVTGGIAGVIVGSAIGSYVTDDAAPVEEKTAVVAAPVEAVAVVEEAAPVETAPVAQAAEPAQWVPGSVEEGLARWDGLDTTNSSASMNSAAVTADGRSYVGEYVVVQGDNLWDISAKSEIYNNPYHWPLLYKANRNKIEDADLIYPDQSLKFVISEGLSEEAMNSAADHARNRGAWSFGVVVASDEAYLAL